MNSDCAFSIGTTHEICQDYALAKGCGICIADGCSGSLLSDFGARMLSVTAINKINELETLSDFDENEIILLARPSAKILNIPSECLDATLLCAAQKRETLQAVCYGDGTITIKIINGDIFVITTEYTDSYPFYINYLYDETKRLQNWKDNHNKRKITFSIIQTNGEVETAPYYSREGRQDMLYEGEVIGFIYIYPYHIRVEVLASKAKFIALMSDGIQNFYRNVTSETASYGEKISYHDVLKEFVNFKNYAGNFVRRRMNRFIKTCIKNKWYYADDISMAAIHLRN
jgi:hypothetical protein